MQPVTYLQEHYASLAQRQRNNVSLIQLWRHTVAHRKTNLEVFLAALQFAQQEPATSFVSPAAHQRGTQRNLALMRHAPDNMQTSGP